MFIMLYAIHILEDTYACQIIMLLKANTELYMTQFLDHFPGSNYNTIERRVSALADYGVIEKRHEDSKPYRMYLTLTARGERIASHLEEIEKDLAAGAN